MVSLAFDEKPDYERCRNILREGLRARGYRDDGKLVFTSATPVPPSRKPKARQGRKVSKRKSEEMETEDSEDVEVTVPVKKTRGARNSSKTVSVQSTSSEGISQEGEKENNNSSNVNRKVGAKKTLKGKKVQPPKIYTGVENPTPQMLALMQKKMP